MTKKVAKICVKHHLRMMDFYGVLHELNLIKDSTMVLKQASHMVGCNKHMKTLGIDVFEELKKKET